MRGDTIIVLVYINWVILQNYKKDSVCARSNKNSSFYRRRKNSKMKNSKTKDELKNTSVYQILDFVGPRNIYKLVYFQAYMPQKRCGTGIKAYISI